MWSAGSVAWWTNTCAHWEARRKFGDTQGTLLVHHDTTSCRGLHLCSLWLLSSMPFWGSETSCTQNSCLSFLRISISHHFPLASSVTLRVGGLTFLTWTGHHFFVLTISSFTIDQGVQRETRNKDSDIHESESGHSSTSLLVMFFNCMYARLLSRSQGFQMHMGKYTWLVSRLWDTRTNEDSFSEVLEMENLN